MTTFTCSTCPVGSSCSCTHIGEQVLTIRDTYVVGHVETAKDEVRTVSATPPPEVHPGLLQSQVIADLTARVERHGRALDADAAHLKLLSTRLADLERDVCRLGDSLGERLTALEAAAAAPPARKRSTSPAPRAASPSPKARRRTKGPSVSRKPARKAVAPRKRARSRKRIRARST